MSKVFFVLGQVICNFFLFRDTPKDLISFHGCKLHLRERGLSSAQTDLFLEA